MDKEKTTEALFALALHMRGCRVCIEAIMEDRAATPSCTEYQRLKNAAMKMAGKSAE